jgi:hypothetical protein
MDYFLYFQLIELDNNPAFLISLTRGVISISLQVTQNRADLFVLAFAIMEMADSGGVVAGYLGGGTMKMVRLMKVLRPIRLLMRSKVRTHKYPPPHMTCMYPPLHMHTVSHEVQGTYTQVSSSSYAYGFS